MVNKPAGFEPGHAGAFVEIRHPLDWPGVDGWRMADLHSWLASEWRTFNTYELQPTLKGARDLYGHREAISIIMPSR